MASAVAAVTVDGCRSPAAQLTDIAPNPLTTSTPNQVKPNLLFILDDSGSMARDYMPDDVNAFGSNTYALLRLAVQWIGVQPVRNTYSRPVDSAGVAPLPGWFLHVPLTRRILSSQRHDHPRRRLRSRSGQLARHRGWYLPGELLQWQHRSRCTATTTPDC